MDKVIWVARTINGDVLAMHEDKDVAHGQGQLRSGGPFTVSRYVRDTGNDRMRVSQETMEFLQGLEYRCGECLHDEKLAKHNRILRALIARCIPDEVVI